MEFHFIGFREIETQYYGAKCSICGDTMVKRQKCMYSSIAKEFRHINCHFAHPANLCEIWLVEREDGCDPETGDPITAQTVIYTDTLSRETCGTRYIRNIKLLESFPKGAKNPLQVRNQYMAELNRPA